MSTHHYPSDVTDAQWALIEPDIPPDNGENFLVELDNATLTNLPGFLADKPDLTLTINRSDLEQTMMGAKTLAAQIQDGTTLLRRCKPPLRPTQSISSKAVCVALSSGAIPAARKKLTAAVL